MSLISLKAQIIRLLLLLIGRTLRIRTLGDEHYKKVSENGRGFIFAVWHGRMLLPIYRHRRMGIITMASLHSDGEMIARVLGSIGYETVRGSTTRGGKKAMSQMLRRAQKGGVFALTPDGPRGPRETVQPGVVFLSQMSGLPILPVTGSARRCKRFNSWDRFLLPFPFSQSLIVYGEPLFADREEDLSTELERRLKSITCQADKLCGIETVERM